jgi:sialate O-acetylesterase
MKKRFLIVLSLLSAGGILADVRLPSLFSDHMVLQRNAEIPVWGWADPGEKITLTLAGRTLSVTADSAGKWTARFASLSPQKPLELTVRGRNTLTVKDVLVGEVWLGSGQSNMDMTVAREDRTWCGVDREAEEIAAADYPMIREFKVKLDMTDRPREDAVGQWVLCSPSTAGKFSATAYFFGRELFRKLKMPVGLVVSSYGASTAQAWTGRKALEARPDLVQLLDAYDALCRDYDTGDSVKIKFERALKTWEGEAREARAEGKNPPRRPRDPNPHRDQHNPCVLYNGMIAPLIPYAIRGAIWYQGESNYPTGKIYFNLMETLIRDWRDSWGQGDFPFLFVQLAANKKLAADPNAPSEMAPVREGQLKTLTLPNTGMAVAIDIGDADNIHPKNKQELGRRLGLVARARVYGESVPDCGPVYDHMILEGGAIRLAFRCAGAGLCVPKSANGIPTGFAVAGADRKFVWADAKIRGKTVIVSSPQVPRPVAARYGWADNPPVNLTDKSGLPASPFRTDRW